MFFHSRYFGPRAFGLLTLVSLLILTNHAHGLNIDPGKTAFDTGGPMYRELEAHRLYSGLFWATEGSQVEIETRNSLGDTDPVMFVFWPGGTASSDDQLLTRSVILESKVDFVADTTGWLRVVVTSYDIDYTGTTDIIFRTKEPDEGWREQQIEDVRIGGEVVTNNWKVGDLITTTSHYEGFSLEESCLEELSSQEGIEHTRWISQTRTCLVQTAGEILKLDPEELCESLTLSDLGNVFEYAAVNRRSSRCEYASDINDTVVVAVGNWSKMMAQCQPGKDQVCFELKRKINANIDENHSTNGRFEMELTTPPSISPALVVGFYPWNSNYQAADPVDMMRFYLDRLSPGGQDNRYHDNDHDGLSNVLEAVSLFIDPENPDGDNDGIMDSLEIYGGRYADVELALPRLGSDPDEKNLVIEIDRQNTLSDTTTEEIIGDSLELAYEAFAAADYHTLFIEEQANANAIVPDDTLVDIEDPSSSLETTVCPAHWLDQPSLAGSFDLAQYPFARRILWVQNLDAPNAHTVFHQDCWQDSKGRKDQCMLLPTGKFITVVGGGSTLVHEIGHLLGLSHSGPGWQFRPIVASTDDPEKKQFKEYARNPNYWSVMSYGITLPLHQLADGREMNRDVAMIHEQSASIGRPPYFSSKPMVDLNERRLFEWEGLVGHDENEEPNTFVFHKIINPITGEVDEDFPVSWIDWDRNKDNTEVAVQSDIAGQCTWVELPGGGYWRNLLTGVTGDESACLDDVLPGRYQVGTRVAPMEVSSDVEYLKMADMSEWAWGADGAKQYEIVTGKTRLAIYSLADF